MSHVRLALSIVAFLVAALVVVHAVAERREPLASSPAGGILIAESEPESTLTVEVQLGVTDVKPTSWNGSARAEGASIRRVRGWRLGDGMSVDAHAASWRCGTWWGPEPRQRPFDNHMPEQPRPFVRPSLLVDIDASDRSDARLRFTTDQGAWEVDLARLVGWGSSTHLDGRVACTRAISGRDLATGVELKASGAEGRWHDFPAVAVSPADGEEVAVAYQTYANREGGDQVSVRRRSAGAWLAPESLAPAGGDYYGTAAAYDGSGSLWVVYAAQIDGNWDLYGRLRAKGRWQPKVRLSSGAEPDMHHSLVRAADGQVWLIWQGFVQGLSSIFVRCWDGAQWSRPLRVSDGASNAWEPAAAALPERGIVVAWDSYQGDYDVFCRIVGTAVPQGLGPVIRVAGGPTFEARPSVACDRAGRVWVAYDRDGTQWGKDTGFWFELDKQPQGSRLYGSRTIGLRLVDPKAGTVLEAPAAAVNLALNRTAQERIEKPQLVRDSDGRVWLFYRRFSVLDSSRRGIGRRFQWQLEGTYFDAGLRQWAGEHLVADSMGRLDMRPALAAGSGALWAAWATDERSFGKSARPDVCSVFAGRVALAGLPQAPAGALETRALEAFPDKLAFPPHPREREDVARVRGYSIDAGSAKYRIFRGDMHRHTDTSDDGGGDGSLLDAYRYAIDAARLDFLLVTDHNDGASEYGWWRREKSNDLFRAGESFVGLFGYERSAPYPNGHRNVFFARRGVRPLPLDPREAARENGVNSGGVLYPYLKANHGICFSHSSATGMGTDWRDNDAALEPLVEIFQGDRTNYEKLGAPWSARQDQVGTQEGGFHPDGYVNVALGKGLRLGFQASSDHLSTHLSYSCILAERNTRDALMDAMRRRHAYAATDNIILDVRGEGATGARIMGDVFETRGAPRLTVNVIGTGGLREVVVIKDDRVVYSTTRPDNRASFTYVDTDAVRGRESYYYVRVLQQDQQMAWSSPMWVTAR